MSPRAFWFFIACVGLAFAGEVLALWHLRPPGADCERVGRRWVTNGRFAGGGYCELLEPLEPPPPLNAVGGRSHPLDLVGRP